MSNLLPDHQQVSPSQFLELVGGDGWRVVGDGCTAFFRTDSFGASTRFVDAIGRLQGVDGHPPAVDIRYDGVTVRVVTVADNWMGPSTHDVELARAVTGVAREQGLRAEPS